MSRFLRTMPFDSLVCECRPGHMLCWLCGVAEELEPRQHANRSKPAPVPRHAPTVDQHRAKKGQTSEAATA